MVLDVAKSDQPVEQATDRVGPDENGLPFRVSQRGCEQLPHRLRTRYVARLTVDPGIECGELIGRKP